MTQEQEKQVSAVIAALDETRLVAKLNKSVRIQNLEIRKANAKIRVENQRRRKKAAVEQIAADKVADEQKVKRTKVKPELLKTTRLLPYAHQVSTSTKTCLQRERNLRKKLESRTPQTWLAKILRLPTEQQASVACIVWWDYFSSRPVTDRWDHLDRWIKNLPVPSAQEEVQNNLLEEALCSLGYSPYHARQRLTKENN